MSALLLTINSCSTPAPQALHPALRPAAPQTILNSEHIRQKYGSFGIQVLHDSETLRVSRLYSVAGDRKIMRTFAMVIYPPTIPLPILSEHREIKSGQSMGEVFKRNGWDIEKQTLYIGDIAPSPLFAGIYSSMGLASSSSLAIHIYRFDVSRPGTRIAYATLAEVHHPDYLNPVELKEIHGADFPGLERDKEELEPILDTVVRAMKEFPRTPAGPESPAITD